MQDMGQVMAKIFLEQRLKEEARWRLMRSRWGFASHRHSNPAHRRWKLLRASGRR